MEKRNTQAREEKQFFFEVRSLLRMRGNYIVTLQSEEFRYGPTRFEGSDERRR
jgi:hypothetical protein